MMAKGKVLLIEDEADLARLFELALGRDGLRIRRARDAAAGLEAFRRWSPDVILLDVVLPDRCGLDLLEDLRAESRVPVILISGRRRPADQARADAFGVEAYLVKPFPLTELRSRVRLALSRAAAPGPKRSSPARRPAGRSSPR
ncbi:MAG: response regulator [Elusimicrobiota bacterium]|nr:response regulator [Elusimicrobiota bacterium]